jgi:archaellum component FlaC
MEESREKYWSELTTDEKVERMRDQVKSLIRIVDRLNYKLNLLFRHSHHDHEGRVTIPIDECREAIGAIGGRVKPENKDDVYF